MNTNDTEQQQAIVPAPDDEKAKRTADLNAWLATDAVMRSTPVGRAYSGYSSKVGDAEYLDKMTDQVMRVRKGNLKRLEDMLVAQANTLDAVFNHHALEAFNTQRIDHMRTHLSLALKAQSQCRTTVEALAEIKNPRPVAFVRQANIAAGPQQVNNGGAPPAPAARETEVSESNELLEHHHGERLDFGTAQETGRGNQALEAVGEVLRPDQS
jgi:hypothetical protein